MVISRNTASASARKFDYQRLFEIQSGKAKAWWRNYIILQVLLVVVSAFLVVTGNLSDLVAIVIVVLGALSSVVRLYADHLKGGFEITLGKFDFYDGLGWEISARERGTWLRELDEDARREITRIDRKPKSYNASHKIAGKVRLLENLEQSSCWSNDIALRAGAAFALVLASFSILGFIVFMGTALDSNDSTLVRKAARVLVTVVSAMFTIGFVRWTYLYFRFAFAAGRLEEKVSEILNDDSSISEGEAVKLVCEYQSLRAVTPMLPDWIYRIRNKTLEEVWLSTRLRS